MSTALLARLGALSVSIVFTFLIFCTLLSIDVCSKEGRHFIAYAPDEGKFASCSDVIDAIYLRKQKEHSEALASKNEETENIVTIDLEDVESIVA